MIPYGRQDISEADIEAVVEVLRSDFLTQGPAVPNFEKAIADYCGARHAVAVNSATSALHIACMALGLGSGDIMWTTPITFVASANCALYCGAEVEFVDIDPQTFNLSIAALSSKLEQAEKAGRLPKVVIPVHLCGLPCDMKALGALAKRYGFYVIEDASHAIGGKYESEPIGNCNYSDITVFSFHPVKIITTGEGGVAVTRSHGITRDPQCMTHESDDDWYYQQIERGYNYRMTDIQAALGLSQMSRLDKYVTRRHELARRYDEYLMDLPVSSQHRPDACYSGMHLYVIRLELGSITKSHRQVFTELREAGIGVNLHYIPVYSQPYYQKRGFNPVDFPEAESYYAEAISLPMYPALTHAQQDQVLEELGKALQV